MGRYPIRSYYHYFASTLASAANIPSAILGNVWFAMTARPFSPMLVQEDRRAIAVLIVRIVASRSPGGDRPPRSFSGYQVGHAATTLADDYRHSASHRFINDQPPRLIRCIG